MSTQDHTNIPFSHTSSQSPIRLVELPAKLLSLLTSEKPPILKIKSAPQQPPTDSSVKHSSEAHAVLCTPTETFSLKHVHSSNAIFLLKPSLQDPGYLGPGEVIPEYGASIVSTATSYLELLPIAPVPVAYLRRLLPIYHGWDGIEYGAEGDLQTHDLEICKSGWEGIRDKIPVSDAEFMRGWIEVAGFELNSVPHRPSPTLALSLLTKIQFAATLSSIELFDTSMPFSTSTIHAALSEDECPTAILGAVLRRICDPLHGQWGHDEIDDGLGWTLSKDRLKEWVGRLILEKESEKGTLDIFGRQGHLSLESFMDQWKKSLPDDCQDVPLSINMLNGYHYLPTSNTISFLEPGTTPPSDVPSATPVSTGTVKLKGKWHEKFAKKRKYGI